MKTESHRKLFRRKILFFVPIFFLLLIFGIWGFLSQYDNKCFGALSGKDAASNAQAEKTSKSEKGAPASQLLSVRVLLAKRQKLANIRPYIGRFIELKKVTLSPEVGGVLLKLPVEIGDKVVGGETVIAEIDTFWNDMALKQAQTQINLLETQLSLQKKEMERLDKLRTSRSITESELDIQETAVRELELQIETAKLSKDEITERLKRSKIIAPFDGYVVQKHAELGQLLSPGTNIVDIISRGEIDAQILIGERFIDRIRLGDKIPLRVETLPEEILGEVIAIVPYGPTGSRTFPVKLRVKDTEEKLKVGMSLEAFITESSPREGIVVPQDAVLERPEGYTTWIALSEQKTEQESTKKTATVFAIPVQVLVRTPDEYLIEPLTDEGKKLLDDGVQVVVEGAERLAQNQTVQIIDINPDILQNLPKASGHQTFEPQPRRTVK